MINKKRQTIMNKEMDRAFGKQVLLLGIKDGEKVWLEMPTFDCNWYWGFGYLETYTGSQPSKSRDILSHTH